MVSFWAMLLPLLCCTWNSYIQCRLLCWSCHLSVIPTHVREGPWSKLIDLSSCAHLNTIRSSFGGMHKQSSAIGYQFSCLDPCPFKDCLYWATIGFTSYHVHVGSRFLICPSTFILILHLGTFRAFYLLCTRVLSRNSSRSVHALLQYAPGMW